MRNGRAWKHIATWKHRAHHIWPP